MLTASCLRAPGTFYKPPYVGVRGWVGIELARISDEDLSLHVNLAWELVAPKRRLARGSAAKEPAQPARKRGPR